MQPRLAINTYKKVFRALQLALGRDTSRITAYEQCVSLSSATTPTSNLPSHSHANKLHLDVPSFLPSHKKYDQHPNTAKHRREPRVGKDETQTTPRSKTVPPVEQPTIVAGGQGLAVLPHALEAGAHLVCRLVGRPREASTWSRPPTAGLFCVSHTHTHQCKRTSALAGCT